jgi:LmbE family N-acetylglucosaminyl deacetylase
MRVVEPEALGFERVLAVGAHPDDAEFYAGATLARLAAAGARVVLLVATGGQRGSLERRADLLATRAAEQAAAAAALGCHAHASLGRMDGELEPDRELLAELVEAIRRERPDLVLTHDPRTRFSVMEGIAQPGHSDHRATGGAVLDAVMPRAPNPNFFPEQLEDTGLRPWYPREVWLFDTAEPDLLVPVAPVRERKLAALRAHASQNGHDLLAREAERRGDEGLLRLVLYRRDG